MRRGAAHLTVVVGNPSTAVDLQSALEGHGVDHAAVVAHINSIRRSLVLGENDFVVVCIALDRRTIEQHGPEIRSLLSDHQCFPTTVRTVGLLSDLGLTREVAELGCDVYVDDSAQAARAIRLLDDEWSSSESAAAPAPQPHRGWLIRGGWMCGEPDLPEELTSLVSTNRDQFGNGSMTPRWTEGTSDGFGDPHGGPQ